MSVYDLIWKCATFNLGAHAFNAFPVYHVLRISHVRIEKDIFHHGSKIISRQKRSHYGSKMISRQKMSHYGSKMISRKKMFHHGSHDSGAPCAREARERSTITKINQPSEKFWLSRQRTSVRTDFPGSGK